MVIGGAVAVGLVIWLASRGGGGRRKTTGTATLRRRLHKLTHDAAVAERLVDAETKRHPDLPEREILRRVIRRLERDRGR